MSTEFIKMISELHEERFNVHIGEMIRARTPCGIFLGFNFNPHAMAANVQMFIKNGLNVTCALVISNVQKESLKNFTDVPVITLEELPRIQGIELRTVFILEGLKDFALVPYFERHGIEVLRVMSGDEKFFFTMKHLPELHSAYEMLGDEESKKVFCASIKGGVTGKISDYRFAPEPQYFLYDFTPKTDDIAIDGGAFDGATSIDFAKCGAKVFAFEMNAANYNNCQSRINGSGGGL